MHKCHYGAASIGFQDMCEKVAQCKSRRAIKLLRKKLNDIMDRVLSNEAPISYNHAVYNMLDLLKDEADGGEKILREHDRR